jgi:GT2 family glycosyltransferase
MMRYGMFLEHKGRAGAAAHEDLELGYRLAEKGMRLLYAKDALGYHYHVSTLDQTIRRWYERGMNYSEFRVFANHPRLTVFWLNPGLIVL